MKNICTLALTAFAAMLTVSCASDFGTAEKSVPAETLFQNVHPILV